MSMSRDELNELLWYIAGELDIPSSYRDRAKERYEGMGRWLRSSDSDINHLEPSVYVQGSMALDTVIKPNTADGGYDLDLVCEVNLGSEKITQRKLKEVTGAEINKYAATHSMNSEPQSGRHCWTLEYSDKVNFHMDIVPAIPARDAYYSNLFEKRGSASNYLDTAIAITDNLAPNYELLDHRWPHSNPKAFKNWFDERKEVKLSLVQEEMIKAASGTQDTFPAVSPKTPLQAVIQIFKRLRDVKFEDNKDKPASIMITTLSGLIYNNQDDLFESLLSISSNFNNQIENRGGIYRLPNPVDPEENLARKWNEPAGARRKDNFYSWTSKVTSIISSLSGASSEGEILRLLGISIGETYVKTAADRLDEARRKRSPVITKTNQSLSSFSVPHRKHPKWQIELHLSIEVKIEAIYQRKRGGFLPRNFQSGTELPKDCSLRFTARTNANRPYDVYWQVVNTGTEAERANSLRGGFYESSEIVEGRKLRKESTLYEGFHWIECFIVKNGVCIARSGEFIVNII